MKTIIKKFTKTLSRIAKRDNTDDMMMYFRVEYKSDPIGAYDYWITTNGQNYSS